MRKEEKQIIDQVLDFWQSYTPDELSREDARQIMENVTGFFRVLLEWDAAEKRVPTGNDTANAVIQKEIRKVV